MSFPKSDKIWMNGKLVPWDDAKIHIGSHVIHYGSAVFEGLRCYATPEGPAGLPARRPHRAPLQLRQDLPHGRAATRRTSSTRPILETVAANKLDACYIRPIIYRGYGQLGREPVPLPGRRGDHGLGLGQVPGHGGAGEGRGRAGQLLDAHRAQHAARHGQDRRQLHELAAHQDGGHQGGLRGGHRPRRRGLPLRGQRREPVPGQERHAAHAAAGLLGPARASRATP